jgi:hypothetical protein
MAVEDLIQHELMLNRFRRLVRELMQGTISRNSFEPWEVEILLDCERCKLHPKQRLGTLQRYLKAVEKQMEIGPGPPMKLSEFIQSRTTRRPSTL